MRILFLLLFTFYFSAIYSQKDTIVEQNLFNDTYKTLKVDARIIQKKLETNKNPSDLSYLFYKKNTKLSLSVDLDIKKYFDKPKDNKSILEVQNIEDEDDVIVYKYFNGENKTNKKLKSSQYLGTIHSNTKFVKIEYRDFGLEDGDRVKVYIDNKPYAGNVSLSNDYYSLQINLDSKGYHQIDIEALNQGLYGPNTAEFIVYDDMGNVLIHKAWDLTTGKVATLGIVRF
jgi:hypothetical protein